MRLHFPSRLYGIRVCTEHKRCQDKKRKGIDRYSLCPPTLFLVAGSLFGTNFVRAPFLSNISCENNKNSGPLSPKYALCPMLFKYFNII